MAKAAGFSGAEARAAGYTCKEARAALLGLQLSAQKIEHHRTLVLSLGDNLSECLAYDRGRSRDDTGCAVGARAMGRGLGARRGA